MTKAVLSLHCLVFVSVSSTEQSGQHQTGAWIDDMIKAVSSSCTALSFSVQLHRAVGPPSRCLDRGDMTKSVSSLHCLVFVGASSKERSGHRQVPGLTT